MEEHYFETVDSSFAGMVLDLKVGLASGIHVRSDGFFSRLRACQRLHSDPAFGHSAKTYREKDYCELLRLSSDHRCSNQGWKPGLRDLGWDWLN